MIQQAQIKSLMSSAREGDEQRHMSWHSANGRGPMSGPHRADEHRAAYGTWPVLATKLLGHRACFDLIASQCTEPLHKASLSCPLQQDLFLCLQCRHRRPRAVVAWSRRKADNTAGQDSNKGIGDAVGRETNPSFVSLHQEAEEAS